jgi:hypothetical protein
VLVGAVTTNPSTNSAGLRFWTYGLPYVTYDFSARPRVPHFLP